MQDSEPNTLPTELFQPLIVTSIMSLIIHSISCNISKLYTGITRFCLHFSVLYPPTPPLQPSTHCPTCTTSCNCLTLDISVLHPPPLQPSTHCPTCSPVPLHVTVLPSIFQYFTPTSSPLQPLPTAPPVHLYHFM